MNRNKKLTGELAVAGAWIYRALTLFALLLTANAHASIYPVELLIDSNGNLMGANKVFINDVYYDVHFIDGNCTSIFGGCDSGSDLIFQNEALATSASQALLDQVFLSEFDDLPGKTNGCGFTLFCNVSTPFLIFTTSDTIWMRNARNYSLASAAPDSTEWAGNAARSVLDYSDNSAHVWAVWTPSNISSVPEPISLLLLIACLPALLYSKQSMRGRCVVRTPSY